MAILKSEKLFPKYNAWLNINTKSFSLGRKEQLSEETISKTLKMLFCPICDIYDCGIHCDDNTNFALSHHYISHKNRPTQKKNITSAKALLLHYHKLIRDEPILQG